MKKAALVTWSLVKDILVIGMLVFLAVKALSPQQVACDCTTTGECAMGGTTRPSAPPLPPEGSPPAGTDFLPPSPPEGLVPPGATTPPSPPLMPNTTPVPLTPPELPAPVPPTP